MELLADDRLSEQPEATTNDQMESLGDDHHTGVEDLMEPRRGNHLDDIVDVQVDYLLITNNVSRFKKCSVVTRQHLDRKVHSSPSIRANHKWRRFLKFRKAQYTTEDWIRYIKRYGYFRIDGEPLPLTHFLVHRKVKTLGPFIKETFYEHPLGEYIIAHGMRQLEDGEGSPECDGKRDISAVGHF
jgi:hypothetical protein